MKHPKILYVELDVDRLENSILYENKDAINNAMIQNRVDHVRVGVYVLQELIDFELGYKVDERKVIDA